MFAKVWCALVTLALTAVAFPQTAMAIIMNDGAASDTTWQQAYQTLGEQYPSVVGLYAYNGTGWQNEGSGVVISAYNVLTAAHCILGNNGNQFSKFRMVTGNNLVSDYRGVYATTQASVIPQYTNVITSPDIGVLTFSQSINVTPAKLYTGSDSALVGSDLILSGFGNYGYPSTGEIPLDGQKRGCQDPLWELGFSPWGAGTDQLVMSFDPPGFSDYRYLGGKSAHGDSGGGWFTTEGLLAGINDWSSNGTGYVTISGATSVSQHYDWIESEIVAEPGTFMLLGVAAGALLICQTKRLGMKKTSLIAGYTC